MTDKEKVIKFMSNIKGKTPILLIGKAATIFENIYSRRIYNIKNEDDMKDVQGMSECRLNTPVVLKDLSELYTDEDLLKLIEESSLQFILLAYKDNLSDTLMSRCKSFLKISNIDVHKCKYISKKSALSSMTGDRYKDNIFLMENCPALMRDMIDTQFLKYKERVVGILANMEGGINDE